MSRLSIPLGLILMLAVSLLAQDSLQFQAATTGAACQEVAYHDGYLYAGAGSTLMVFDVSGESSPPYDVLSELRFKSRIVDLTIRDHFLYVSANHAGISKWNISSPAAPTLVDEYIPDNTEDAAYDISFFGDTLFVANDSKVSIFHDTGSTLQELGEFGHPSPSGSVWGTAVKDTLVAYVVAQGGDADGVYIHDARDLSFLGFYPESFTDPEDVVFGQSTNLLHVLAGTRSFHNVADGRGYFYSLDIAEVSNPRLAFADTIWGWPAYSIAEPMNAEIRNDTIFVATLGGLQPGQLIADTCYIRVYDATQPDDVHLIAYLPGGLYHFDVALNGSELHIASEWYGLWSLDISDITDPQLIGATPTGGWNMGSDKYGDRLIVANEGHGFKMYDVSSITNPELIDENNDPLFCHITKFSEGGSYVYAFYASYDGFRVFDASTLAEIGSLPDHVGNIEAFVYGDRVYAGFRPFVGTERINVIDVSSPTSPQLILSDTVQINDMFLDDSGLLYIVNNKSIIVYDIANDSLKVILEHDLESFEDAKTLAVNEDYLFVYVTNLGQNRLARFTLSENGGGSFSLVEESAADIGSTSPQHMAADATSVYVVYRRDGLYALDPETFEELGSYRNGLDYRGMFGPTDLFCRDGYVFLTEYFEQTTILANLTGSADLSGEIINGELVLTWAVIPGATEYWVFGAGNHPYFQPGGSPTYEYRLSILPAGTTTWSTTAGIGDPGSEWTYLVTAVNDSESELARSNRYGEREFASTGL